MARTWLPQLLAIFTSFAAFITVTLAHDVLQSPTVYDWGFYGLYPRTWFNSFGLAEPRLNFLKWEEQCTDGLYLLSPRGSYVSVPGPVIMDGRGNMVWRADDRFGDAEGITDFKVQMFNGKPHLTFWAGTNGAHHRFGYGVNYVLDETYQIVKIVTAVETRGHSLRADLHEFHITPDNTGLMSVYYPQPIDLSPVGGPVDGWVLDSIFQEVDLNTGELIFEWRASEHIPVETTMRSFVGSDLGYTPDTGFDYFHINSVDKDHLGNYIISARHTHTVTCISPEGETLWVLGGKHNMFKDLSDGRATDFTWQHHARWHGTNTLSLFDNAKSTNGGNKYMGDHSRGLILELDTEAMTAKLVHDYYDPKHPKLAESQGSMQIMDNGKVIVDYGFFPALTEFSPEGEVICDIRLAPWLIWQAGMVTSYRGFKTDKWVGKPWYAPEVVLRPSESVLYVSWNGATEVDRWVLQGADWEGVGRDVYEDLDIQTKDGFESRFDLSGDYPQYVRIAALDKNGEVLKHTIVMDRYVGNAKSSGFHGFLFTVCVVSAFLAVVALFRKNIGSAWKKGFTQGPVAGVRGVFAAVRRSAELKFGGKTQYNELQTYED